MSERYNEKPLLLYPPHNEVVGVGVYWFHSVRPSVRPASRVRSVAPTVLVDFIFIHLISSNFWRCVACDVSCEIWIFCNLFLFVTLNLFSFDWCESPVWVIMGRRGISERRRSSCSSYWTVKILRNYILCRNVLVFSPASFHADFETHILLIGSFVNFHIV